MTISIWTNQGLRPVCGCEFVLEGQDTIHSRPRPVYQVWKRNVPLNLVKYNLVRLCKSWWHHSSAMGQMYSFAPDWDVPCDRVRRAIQAVEYEGIDEDILSFLRSLESSTITQTGEFKDVWGKPLAKKKFKNLTQNHQKRWKGYEQSFLQQPPVSSYYDLREWTHCFRNVISV